MDFPRSYYEHIIDEWIFSEIDRAILRRRLLDGICFDQIAEEICLSTVQTKKRFYKAEKMLYKHICVG